MQELYKTQDEFAVYKLGITETLDHAIRFYSKYLRIKFF